MQLGPSSGAKISDGLMAAMVLLSEKPRQGVPSRNPALHPGIDERNSTVALGLRAGEQLNRVRSRYTGKERDTESGNDYFGARYYASTMGRWMSPDPVFASAARVMDPQQWNMYAYARNNPLSITDPTGLDFNLTCTAAADGSNVSTCQGGVQGTTSTDANGKSSFTATDVDMNDPNDAGAGYHDQSGNQYTGTFDQNNGVSFTDANGNTSSHSQFIDGSDPTQLSGSGAFTGIQGNFFDACGASSSCQGRAILSGSPDAFSNMESMLNKQSRFSTLLDGLSLAHPFITDQWKGGDGGYAHVIKAPGYMWDMHFEGSSPGAGVTGLALHMMGTIKDMVDGTARGERAKMVPEQ
jgi:RHS repeat-associated protein